MDRNCLNLIDVLDVRAAANPHKTAFQFLGNDGAELCRLSYLDLLTGSRAFASRLQTEFVPGDRVVIAASSGPAAVLAFLGCLQAGVVPALSPAPRHKKDRRSLDRLERIIAMIAPRRLYAAEESLDALGSIQLSTACTLAALDDRSATANDGDQAAAQAWARPAIDGESPAYIQFTSGSTANPRGVVLRHRNVLANLALISRVFGPDENVRGFGWLPLHHDMGLVGHVLEPLYAGGSSVLAPPEMFSRNPLSWLEAIARYRATDSGAPPFAYQLCAQHGGALPSHLDLSCWRNAYCGAEPIPLGVLEQFARRFAPHGFARAAFLPCYGLAEATLFVAGGKRPDGWRSTGNPARLCYELAPEFDVRILSEDGRTEQDEGEAGEIAIAGCSVAEEYRQDPNAWPAAQVLLRIGESDQAFLRTGDLGFVSGGDLVVTGRKSDLIIVRGVNYHPEDLEEAAVSAHEPPRQDALACFSIPGPATEEVMLVQEAKSSQGGLAETAAAMETAIGEGHGLPVSVVFVKRGSIPRTSSGKISRRACRGAWLDGTLQTSVIWQNGICATSRETHPAQSGRNSARDVAVIGMACRFPGANGLGSFWTLLTEGVDAIQEVPRDRWDSDLYYDPNPAVPGKMNTRWGGFIDAIDRFDAGFFGIAPQEAVEMDPQQRLVLEVAWRTLEHAGLTMERLTGSNTGVFIGISTTDYLHVQIKTRPGLEGYNAYTGLGSAHSIAANRLSYALNLCGPSVAVDTACSSSLTAMHMAVQSLRNGECSLAIAGGVNAILSPGTTVALSQFNMMAPDGRCKVFDARADGYVRSEGCGLVVLKRGEDAARDGDTPLAYVRGSAINQDGRSRGITAPNPDAQREVMEKALADAVCPARDVTFVEAHGTGTSAGDPVEVEQIRRVYGGDTVLGPCHLGSVKASVGHLESAAGVASFIKVVLALSKGEIPPQIHFQTLHPGIALDGSRLVIPRRRASWEMPASSRRIAALSSFGFGGANAHMILEEAGTSAPRQTPPADRRPELFVLSARSGAALGGLAREWVSFLDRPSDVRPIDVRLAALAHAQAVRRSHFARRAAVVADSVEELRAELAAFAESRVSGQPSAPACDGIAFLFSGQGSQYAGMGAQLRERFGVFRESFDRCAAVFTECDGARRPLEMLHYTGDPLILPPALFALEYALARLWISLGIVPAALVGHSLGEYAAACIAGCFEPEDGMRLVLTRASLTASIATPGAMAAIGCSVSIVRGLLERENLTGLSIAAINSPDTTVISGAADILERALATFAPQRIATRRLNTSQGFHSKLMDEILDPFEAAAASISYRAPRIPLISNVTGETLAAAPTPEYWRRHLRECVRFSDSIAQLRGRGISVFLETGPGDGLSSLARRCDPHCLPLPSIEGAQREAIALLRTAGRLYTLGANFDWSAMYPEGIRGRVPDLPGHPFHPKSYWFSDEVSAGAFRDEPAPPSKVHHAGWLYDVRWSRSDPPNEAARSLDEDDARHWIVFGDGRGLAAELSARLGRDKCVVFRVSYDATVERGFRRTTDRKSGVMRFFVRPGCPAGIYNEVLSEIMTRLSRADADRWNIVYLRPFDCTEPEQTTVESLERDQDLCSTADLAALAQALTRMVALKRLWVVTANAQDVLADGVDAPVRVAQTPVWGFAHTLFLEHPEMRGSLTDLAANDSLEEQARQLLDSISALDGESQAAFRGGVRYVPRLTAVAPSTAEPLMLRCDGAYLVTGGLGGLGLRSALWMAERGAGHIVLLGRRGLPDRSTWDTAAAGSEERRKIDTILAIERAGATVEVLTFDVTDHARLAEAVRGIDSGQRRLRGIVHAAGVNWFAKVDELDRAWLLDTLKIKISATWNLHQLTRQCELDFFVMYSSVAGLWGSVNLSHYTAANHFLDGVAWRRRREGLPALSIDWGPWSEAGMSAGQDEARILARLGLRLIPPDRAIQAMEHLMKTGATQATVADIDWRTFQAFVNFFATPPFFSRVSAQPVAAATQSRGRKAEAERIRKLPPAQAHAELLTLLKQDLAAVLLLEPDREIDIQHRFNLMGMDSLTAIAFALRLEGLAGARLPTTLAWNYPTLLDTANYLYELIRGKDAAAETPVPVLESPKPESWFPGLAAADDSKPRLFCFPYAGAGASVYREWSAALASVAQVVPVQLPGREERAAQPPFRKIRELAARLADAFESVDPALFAFFGHSMGALAAFEVARELRRRGRPQPQRLILSACAAPEAGRRGEIHLLPDDEFRDRLTREFAAPQAMADDEAWWRALLPVLRADVALMEDFAIGDEAPLNIPVTVFGGRDDAAAPRERLLGWSALTSGDFAIRLFAGGHMYIRDSAPLFDALRDELGRIAVHERAAASV